MKESHMPPPLPHQRRNPLDILIVPIELNFVYIQTEIETLHFFFSDGYVTCCMYVGGSILLPPSPLLPIEITIELDRFMMPLWPSPWCTPWSSVALCCRVRIESDCPPPLLFLFWTPSWYWLRLCSILPSLGRVLRTLAYFVVIIRHVQFGS